LNKGKISEKVKENWIAFNEWRLLTCKPRTSHAIFAGRLLEEIITAFFVVWRLNGGDYRRIFVSRNITKYPSMIAPLDEAHKNAAHRLHWQIREAASLEVSRGLISTIKL